MTTGSKSYEADIARWPLNSFLWWSKCPNVSDMNHTEATATIKSHISLLNSLHVKIEDNYLPEVVHHLFILIYKTELLHLTCCKGSKPITDSKLQSLTTPLYFSREWLHFGV